MAAFVGGLSASEPRNWGLCKEVGLWGLPGGRRPPSGIEYGDCLYIWKSRVGYTAEARITGPARVATDSSETPWRGGLERFRFVIPIEVVLEIDVGCKLPFVKDRQVVTGISTNSLRFGLAPISDEAAAKLRELMVGQR